MLKKNYLVSFVILLLGALAAFQIGNIKTTQAADSHGEEAAESEGHAEKGHAEEAEPKRGPHGGKLLVSGDLSAEVKIYETGIPPEFHLWFYSNNQAVPVKEVQVQAQVVRLGKTDTLSFKPENDYLRSEQVVYEPHSFEARFQGQYKGQKYAWQFSQEEGRLEIAPELLKRSEIQILKAGPQILGTPLHFPGQIALDQDKYVHIVPPLSGRVLDVYKHVGERVQKGEVLAVIHSRELADLRLERQLLQQKQTGERRLLTREESLSANTRKLLQLLRQGQDPEAIHRQMMNTPVGENKGTLVTAWSELRLARQALSREHQLRAEKLSSQEALQTAQKDYDSALSRYIATFEEVIWQRENSLALKRQDLQMVQSQTGALEEKMRVLQAPVTQAKGAQARFELRSPISGMITEKHVALGESVDGAQTLFVIADLSIVWAEMLVPDTQLSRIQFGQQVKITAQDGSHEAFGTVSHISPVVDPLTRRAESHAHITNLDGFWRPGMFINVEIKTDPRRVPVAVAKTALQSYNDWKVVYGKFGDLFEIRPLELGQEDAHWVEVKSGLKAGQAYAATNSFIIKAELGKKSASHDH